MFCLADCCVQFTGRYRVKGVATPVVKLISVLIIVAVSRTSRIVTNESAHERWMWVAQILPSLSTVWEFRFRRTALLVDEQWTELASGFSFSILCLVNCKEDLAWASRYMDVLWDQAF